MGQPITLLFITKDFKDHVERSTFYLSNELNKHTNLLLWHDHGDINYIIKRLTVKPDFILLNDFKPDYSPFIRNIGQSPIPFGIIMHDLKYKILKRKRWMKQENVKHIFTIYRDPFKNWYPEFMDRMMWLPHHVPLHIFKEYRFKKKYDLLMSGALFKHLYPLRHKLYTFYKEDPKFTYIPHPGYRNIETSEEGVFVGNRYSQLLNQAKVFLTCDSNDHFPVLKYYEASASGTCLLAPLNQELKDLGFLDKETIIEINDQDFSSKIEYYLHHPKARRIISQNAMKLIESKHSTEIRVQQLLDYIHQIIEKK